MRWFLLEAQEEAVRNGQTPVYFEGRANRV